MNKLVKLIFRPKRKKESVLKYIYSLLHLILGLLSSIILILVFITGSLYAFKHQIEDLAHRDMVYLDKTIDYQNNINFINTIDIDNIVKDFKTQYGNPKYLKITNPNQSIRITQKEKPSDEFFYDPYKKEILGKKNQNINYIFKVILRVHRWFIFSLKWNINKRPTSKIVGIAGIMLIVLVISGIILWVPKKLKQIKKQLKINWKANFFKKNYQIHSVWGIYTSIILLLMTYTGLYINFNWVADFTLKSLGASDKEIHQKKKITAPQENSSTIKTLKIGKLINTVEKNSRYRGILKIQFPTKKSPYYTFKIYGHEFLNQSCYDKFYISKYNTVIDKEIFRDLALYKKAKLLMERLHTGEILGLPSIILYFVVCTMSCFLPVTGIIIWLKKNKLISSSVTTS